MACTNESSQTNNEKLEVLHVIDQRNAQRDYIEIVVVTSLKDYMATQSAEKHDHQAIESESYYKARLWFGDNRKTREQVIRFIKKEDLTDRRFLFLRITGHLFISETEVNYRPDRARPIMGWTLIAMLTVEIWAGILSAYAKSPEFSHSFLPHFQIFCVWAIFTGILITFFIAPATLMKKRGVS
jgi:hypothetical protein